MARLVKPLEAAFSKVGCGQPICGGYEVLSAGDAAKVGVKRPHAIRDLEDTTGDREWN